MSTYVFMKILERFGGRYDSGIRHITRGKLDEAYDRLASFIGKGQRVLDIGCGTGSLTFRAALKGAEVKGIDINPGMLDVARRRVSQANLTRNVELAEMGVSELGNEEPQSFDVVMSGLCFSELTENELAYTLKETERILKPGGLVLIADEARPVSNFRAAVNWMMRLPVVIITYLVTLTTTHAVRNLPVRITETGFSIESVRYNNMQSFIELVAKKPGAEAR